MKNEILSMKIALRTFYDDMNSKLDRLLGFYYYVHLYICPFVHLESMEVTEGEEQNEGEKLESELELFTGWKRLELVDDWPVLNCRIRCGFCHLEPNNYQKGKCFNHIESRNSR